MLFENDKLQVGTDVFINSKQGRVELNVFCREVIQWVLQIIEIKMKTINRRVFSSLLWVAMFLSQQGNIKSNHFYCHPIGTNIYTGMKFCTLSTMMQPARHLHIFILLTNDRIYNWVFRVLNNVDDMMVLGFEHTTFQSGI